MFFRMTTVAAAFHSLCGFHFMLSFKIDILFAKTYKFTKQLCGNTFLLMLALLLNHLTSAALTGAGKRAIVDKMTIAVTRRSCSCVSIR